MSTQIDDLRAWALLRMRQRRLSHAQVALSCDLDRSTITRFLRGDRSPSLEVALRIMDALYDQACTPPMERMRGLLAGPERVETALRIDPLLDPVHVDVLMRQYFERRTARLPISDDRHQSDHEAPSVPHLASIAQQTSGSGDTNA